MPGMSPLVIVLAITLLISPFVITLSVRQDKKIKRNLRLVWITLLTLQIILGIFNWESFSGPGRSGFELALIFPKSYLWLFFTISLIQFILLTIKKPVLDMVSMILNFINTVVFFAVMIIISDFLGKQIVSIASISTVFIVLIGNVAGLMLINKDRRLHLKNAS